jgi:hypothetical protein
VRYHTRRGVEVSDCQCIDEAMQSGGRRCQTVPGAAVDTAIGQLLLDTLTPLTLGVALTVQAELETHADGADALRRSHVERARRIYPLASMQPPLPVGGDTPSGSWRRLVQWMMFWRREPRAVIKLLVSVVIEPMFSGFETGDQRMPGGFGVGGGVLARRLVAAADVAAPGAPP